MEVLIMALLALTIASGQSKPAPAQETAGQSGVVVVKFSWDKERLGWERDPFAGPVENFDEMRVRARNEKRIDDAKKSGSGEIDRIRREARADAAIFERNRQKSPPRYGFRYKVSLRNESGKAIKSLDWDYLFFDAATNDIVGRIELGSDEKLSVGKQKTFSFFIPTPPAKTISVQALNSKEREGLTEQVVLVRVVYADDTVWERK